MIKCDAINGLINSSVPDIISIGKDLSNNSNGAYSFIREDGSAALSPGDAVLTQVCPICGNTQPIIMYTSETESHLMRTTTKTTRLIACSDCGEITILETSQARHH